MMSVIGRAFTEHITEKHKPAIFFQNLNVTLTLAIQVHVVRMLNVTMVYAHVLLNISETPTLNVDLNAC